MVLAHQTFIRVANALLLAVVNEYRPIWIVVDTVVVAATVLDGYTSLAVREEAGVTLAALGTQIWAL